MGRVQVKYTNQLEAIKLLRDWSTWLVTAQTAALGLITIFYKDGLTLNFWTGLASGCFALSVIVATFVLAGLPSVTQRVEDNSHLHRMKLIEWLPGQLWFYTFLQHLTFLLGFLCLIPLIFSR